MSQIKGKVLLVGSVPFDTVDEVLSVCAAKLDSLAAAYPDGEVGDRRNWVHYLATRTYSHHPDLETVHAPAGGRVVQPSKDADKEEWENSRWKFRIKPGAASLTLPDLGYAEEAQRSYEIFRRLRDDGVLPARTRFQVCLPTTAAAVTGFFADPNDWPVAYKAYRDAIRREIAVTAAAIPHDDLLIQWDICTEVRDVLAGEAQLYPYSPPMTLDEKWELHLGDIHELSRDIPEDIALGYHFCFGTWGGWPTAHASDMGVCVRLSNEVVARAGRRVDYVHMPVMPDADEAFFEPLQDLKIGGTRVYLGIVLDDGLDAFQQRAAAAHRYLPEFGIASYCGWGREEPTEVSRILDDLRDSASRLDEVLEPTTS